MRTRLIVIHISFWALEISRWFYCCLLDDPLTISIWYTGTWFTYTIALFYLNYFVLFPKLVNFKKIYSFFIWGAAFLFAYYLGYASWAYVFKNILLGIHDIRPELFSWSKETNFNWRNLGWSAHLVAFYGAVSTLLRFYWDWHQNKTRSEKIKQTALQSEIDLLEKLIDFPTLDEYLKTIQFSDFKDKKTLILDLSAVLRQNLYNEDLSSEQYKSLLQKLIKLHNLAQEVQCKINFKNTKLNNEHFNEINSILRFKPSLIILSKSGVQYKT